MRAPVTLRPNLNGEASAPEWELDEVPDRPAVFLLWPAEGEPYLARTTVLRRRLRRLLARPDRISRVLRLGGVVDRVEYWPVGSQLEAMLVHFELARQLFPEDWRKLTRLRPPVFLRLTTYNQFPRTMLTTRMGRGLYFGPFANRAIAERYQNDVLDQFQLRRCEENLDPRPEHPGCIYGEMNRCLRPCQAVVSEDEYRHESERVSQFLKTSGSSLVESIEAARDRASTDMEFEEAQRQHERLEKVTEVCRETGEIARWVDRLAGVAVLPSSERECVELLFMVKGRWQEPVQLELRELSTVQDAGGAGDAGAGRSLDTRVRDLVSRALQQETGEAPNPEHLAILNRWHVSSWRDGEWIGFDDPAKIPYRRIVNAIGRVASGKKLAAEVKREPALAPPARGPEH